MSEILLDYADKQRLEKDNDKFEELKELILNAYAVKSSSGSVVSITDGANNVPVKSLTVAVVPNQSGTGDPSPENVRPISGWTGARIIVSPTLEAEDGKTYFVAFTKAGTVYGGTLDVTNGRLTVDKVMNRLSNPDGTGRNWSYASTYNAFAYGSNLAPAVPTGSNGRPTGIVCDIYKTMPYGNNDSYSSDDFLVYAHPTGVIRVRDSRYTTVADFVANAKEHWIVIPLITPVVYELTPTEVTTLVGVNNIWADCGNTSVEYRVDPSIGNSDASNRTNGVNPEDVQTTEIKTVEIDASNKSDEKRVLGDNEDDVNE